MTFGDLFDRAAAASRSGAVGAGDGAIDASDVSNALDAVRSNPRDDDGSTAPAPRDGSPTRVVADADVLAADLLVGGDARSALDVLRAHAWTTLVASDALVDDAEAVIASLAGPTLAADWREAVDGWREPVTHPAGDNPALASAYRGGAMQVVSRDPALTGPRAAAGLRGRFPVSVREPEAFAAVFDPATLYPDAVGGEYPGPDRDPRTLEPVG